MAPFARVPVNRDAFADARQLPFDSSVQNKIDGSRFPLDFAGLLKLLAGTSTPRPARFASPGGFGAANTPGPTAIAQQSSDELKRQRYVSGIADQLNQDDAESEGDSDSNSGSASQLAGKANYGSVFEPRTPLLGDAQAAAVLPAILRGPYVGNGAGERSSAQLLPVQLRLPVPGFGPLAFPQHAFDQWQGDAERGLKGLWKFFRDGSGDSIPVDPDGPGCKEQWNEAYDICAKELSKRRPNRRVTGGHDNIDACMPGWVDARCGGTQPDKPISGSQEKGTAKYRDWRKK
jgi:hypothetical protein